MRYGQQLGNIAREIGKGVVGISKSTATTIKNFLISTKDLAVSVGKGIKHGISKGVEEGKKTYVEKTQERRGDSGPTR